MDTNTNGKINGKRDSKGNQPKLETADNTINVDTVPIDRASRIADAIQIANDARFARIVARCHDFADRLVDVATDNAEAAWARTVLLQHDTLATSAVAFLRGYLAKPSREAKAIAKAAEQDDGNGSDAVRAIALGLDGLAPIHVAKRACVRRETAKARIMTRVDDVPETAHEKAVNGLNRAWHKECAEGRDHKATIGRARSLVSRNFAVADDFDFDLD